MKRVFASTAVAVALMIGGTTVVATTAGAQATPAPIAAIGTGSAGKALVGALQTLLAGQAGCVLGSLFGTTLPTC